MRSAYILTVLGPDRPGLVEELADRVRSQEGNWLESRLMQVEGQFAGLVHFDLPVEHEAAFEGSLKDLEQQTGLRGVLAKGGAQKSVGKRLALECIGQDRPGIVLAISDVFASMGINVEQMDTGVESAPMSGETLFRARFTVQVPDGVDLSDLDGRLAEIGDELMLDVQLT